MKKNGRQGLTGFLAFGLILQAGILLSFAAQPAVSSNLPEILTDCRIVGTCVAADSSEVRFIEFQGSREHSPWWSAQRIVQRMHEDSGGMPIPILMQLINSDPKAKLLAWFKKRPEVVCYRIVFDIPEGADVTFAGKGSLIFTIRKTNGEIIEVADEGIVIPRRFGPIDSWYDTASGPVKIRRGDCFRAPTFPLPIGYVKMPRANYGNEVLKISSPGKVKFVN